MEWVVLAYLFHGQIADGDNAAAYLSLVVIAGHILL